jgi:hypothetical protein
MAREGIRTAIRANSVGARTSDVPIATVGDTDEPRLVEGRPRQRIPRQILRSSCRPDAPPPKDALHILG